MAVLETAGARLAYDAVGQGESVLFVSGLGGMGAFWGEQVAAFGASFRVLTFDHRGVGRSTGEPPYSVAQWCGDVLALLDREGIERVHLVGHSTGGVIAQWFAAENPKRLHSLVLGGTWLKPDRRFRDQFAFRKELLERLGGGAYRMLGDLLSYPAPDATATKSAEMTQAERAIIAARIDALLAFDGTALAPRIATPTLVVGAADDYIVPFSHSRAVADAIAKARLVCLPDGGHFFPRTRAAAYNAALAEFFAETGR